MLFDERVVQVTGHVFGATGDEAMYRLRKRVNSVCSPTLGLGTLIYENDAGRYYIGAFCNANPYADKYPLAQTLDIVFECPDPYWLSYDQYSTRLAYLEGTLTWPLITPGNLGMNQYQATIVNDGDAPAPIEMYIDGGAINPTVTNETTGEFITVSHYIDAFSRLYINSDPEELEVSLITTDLETNAEIRTNAYGYISGGPFKLAVGENKLTFKSDDDSLTVRIYIFYNKLYAGV